MNYRPYLLLITLLLSSCPAFADLSLPRLFSDNMILQRNAEVTIWGRADRKESVTVFFRGQEYSTRANRDGRWQIKLPPTPAGGPHTITLTGKNVINLNDVFFGDVFLASGQSNMEWELHRLPEATQTASEAEAYDIRIFKVEKDLAYAPRSGIKSRGWMRADSSRAMEFSALAYYFARHIHQQQNVPVGIIGAYWGGTAIESWMSSEALADFPQFKETLNNIRRQKTAAGNTYDRYRQDLQKWMLDVQQDDPGFAQQWYHENLDDSGWEEMYLPANWKTSALPGHDGSVWFRKDFVLREPLSREGMMLHLPRVDRHDVVWVNGRQIGSSFTYGRRAYPIPAEQLRQGTNNISIRVFDWQGQSGIMGNEEAFYLEQDERRIALRGFWKYREGIGTEAISRRPAVPFGGASPTLRYNAMIAPLAPFSLKGILWYQGESNTSRAGAYRQLFPAMIADWRQAWGQEVPFLFIQLANFGPAVDQPAPSDWAALREAQSLALELPRTAMATAIDLGEADNIHPAAKAELADRLALQARRLIYEEDVISDGPVFKSMQLMGNQIAITFETGGSPLSTTDRYGYLRGFSIAREDREFAFAKAYIQNDSTIIVYHDDILSPVAVRYAWADNPEDVNLYNGAGLPAFPFRTDDWPLNEEEIGYILE
jgi:sialate O-acetylesterase